jgi:hypothetical protein
MQTKLAFWPALAAAVLLAAPGAWAQRAGRGGASGTVSKVDATAGTLEVSTRQGQTRSVTVPSTAVIVRQTTVMPSDLKVGDTISVAGIPRQIDARQVVSGEDMDALLRPQRQQAAADRPAARARAGAAFNRAGVRVRGTITATSPLQIRLDDGSTVQVAHSSDTVFHRTARATLADVKAGESVRVVMDPRTSTVRAVLVGMEPARRAALDTPRARRAVRARANPAPAP